MTIHELLQAAGLTANDEIPIWDVDGTGEPTKKITAQQLAAAVVALANLVTGVKGNAESSYRTGNVNITPANIGAKAVQSAVSDPTASGTAVAFIDSISQNAQGVISPTKKTVQSASQSAAGLMSAADKTKLDGIEAGAQVNSVTGVKGNAESSYRTGNVNITPANIGAKAVQSAVSDPTASGTAVAFIDSISQNAQGVISPTKKTVQSASQSAAGLMSAADKKKLDGIAAGAAVTSVNNQTGAVSITPANIGAVAKTGDTMTGTLSINRTSDGGEADVEAKSAAGSIYLYSTGSNTGNRGIYSYNASNVPVAVIEVPQDNHTIFYGKATENVAKSGDTMTGPLGIPSLDINGDWPTIYLRSNFSGTLQYVDAIQATPNGQLSLIEYKNGSLSDAYFLPTPTNDARTGYEILTTKSPVLVTQGGTGATDAPGARDNLGIATTVTTFQTNGITANGNFNTGLRPSQHVIDAIYCTAGHIAITPYCNDNDYWFAHCIHPTTGAVITTNFQVTIRYHNIY